MTTSKDLTKYDFFVLIDKSGSMSTPDCPGGMTRYKAAEEATVALARKCAEYDDDGISVMLFNSSTKLYDNQTSDIVPNLFKENEPNGGTDTAKAVKEVGDLYFARKAKGTSKPIICLVVTDGVPNSESELKQVICNIANKIDNDDEFGISFIQIGSDSAATRFLKNLDDGLQGHGAKYDIVDTVTESDMENMSLTDVLIGALDD